MNGVSTFFEKCFRENESALTGKSLWRKLTGEFTRWDKNPRVIIAKSVHFSVIHLTETDSSEYLTLIEREVHILFFKDLNSYVFASVVDGVIYMRDEFCFDVLYRQQYYYQDHKRHFEWLFSSVEFEYDYYKGRRLCMLPATDTFCQRLAEIPTPLVEEQFLELFQSSNK